MNRLNSSWKLIHIKCNSNVHYISALKISSKHLFISISIKIFWNAMTTLSTWYIQHHKKKKKKTKQTNKQKAYKLSKNFNYDSDVIYLNFFWIQWDFNNLLNRSPIHNIINFINSLLKLSYFIIGYRYTKYDALCFIRSLLHNRLLDLLEYKTWSKHKHSETMTMFRIIKMLY